MSNLNVNNLTPLPGQASNTISISGSLLVRDNVKLGGNITIGDVNTDAISINGDFTSSLIPNASGQFDLGASDKRWSSLFVSKISGSVTFTDTVTFGTSTVIVDGNNGNITASNNISASNYVFGHSGSFDYLESDQWVRHTDDADTGIELGADTLSMRVNGFRTAVFRTTDGTVLGHGSFKTSISGSGIHIQGSTIELETDVTASGDLSASANIIANNFVLDTDSKLLFDGESGNDYFTGAGNGQVNLHVNGTQVVTATSNTFTIGTNTDVGGSDITQVDLNALYISASGFMVISQSIFPKNDNTADLGDTNRQWANLHVYTASLAYIQPKGGSGQESITISGSTTFTDNVTFNGTTNIEGTTTNITNLVSTTSSITNLISTTASFSEISSSLIPDADNAFNIGSEANQWEEGHITTMSLARIDAKTSTNGGDILVSGSFIPAIDGGMSSNSSQGLDLGSQTLQWSRLHVYSASLGYIYPKGGSSDLESITISGSTTFTDNVTVTGDIAVNGTASFSEISSSLIPDADNAFNIGSSTKQWKELHTYSASLAYIQPKGGAGLEGITISGSTTFTDDVTFSGNLIGLTSASISFISGGSPITFEGDLLPSINYTVGSAGFDLGSKENKWHQIHAKEVHVPGTASFGNLAEDQFTTTGNGGGALIQSYKNRATMSISYDKVDDVGPMGNTAGGTPNSTIVGHLRVIMNYLPTASVNLTTGSLWVSGSSGHDANDRSGFLMVCGAGQ